MGRGVGKAVIACAALASGCSGGNAAAPAPVKVDGGEGAPALDASSDHEEAGGPCTVAMADFSASAGFFDSPFPSDARLTAAGTPDLSKFPNAGGNALVGEVISLIHQSAQAFALTSSVYFRFSGPLDATGLSDPHASMGPSARAFLVDVDPSSPDLGTRIPAKGIFLENGGPYGASNLLALLPYPGMALDPSTRYAAVVLRTQLDAKGHPVCPSPAVSSILGGTAPDGMSASALAEYTAATAQLAKLGVAAKDIASLAVFTTDNPVAGYEKVKAAMLALPLPQVSGPWMANEVFDSYCVFSNTLPIPDYQSGTPPYMASGGGWVFDGSGNPVQQGTELANIVVTVPRIPMPANGYPIVNMSRTGAGGNRPLVDRGQEATNGGPPIVPGSGPAMYYAAAGFAGASIDGPLGGLRNPYGIDDPGEEDYTIFNVGNPIALRDNVRESAVELSLGASILASLTLDASSCPGATTPDGGPVHFDVGTMALMSHSMGSTISPLTLAFEPRYRAAVLSGAGGSWIDNVVYKLMPLDVAPIVMLLLGITPASGYTMSEGDPVLNLFQWAEESADAPVYDSRTIRHPVDGPAKNILKIQGIVDHYILPPICNATSLSLGLDLGGPALDAKNPALTMFTPLEDVLDLSGRAQLSLPVAGNVLVADGGKVTALVTQHPSDGIEDGHEVMFQTDVPKHEYVCFLTDLAAGRVPQVPLDGPALSPCR